MKCPPFPLDSSVCYSPGTRSAGLIHWEATVFPSPILVCETYVSNYSPPLREVPIYICRVASCLDKFDFRSTRINPLRGEVLGTILAPLIS